MVELADRIEAILKKRADLDEKIEGIYVQKKALAEKLKGIQAQTELFCQDCEHTMVLAEAELVLEIYNEHYCQIDEETYSSERLIWVCPSCAYISNVRSDDDPKWGNPKNLSKKTHFWHSDPGKLRKGEEGALALVEPALKRRQKERDERDKQQRINNARAVLREHGLLEIS